MTWGKEAIALSKELTPSVTGNSHVGTALAQAYFLQKNWEALRHLVKDARWGGLEYLRLTFYARALRELGDDTGFHAQWSAAVAAAVKRPAGIKQLVQTVSAWGWEEETRELLWAVAAGTTEPKYGLALLYRSYLGKKDTAGLLR